MRLLRKLLIKSPWLAMLLLMSPAVVFAQDQEAQIGSESQPGTIIFGQAGAILYSGPEGLTVVVPPGEGQQAAVLNRPDLDTGFLNVYPLEPAGPWLGYPGYAGLPGYAAGTPLQLTCQCNCPSSSDGGEAQTGEIVATPLPTDESQAAGITDGELTPEWSPG